MHRVAAARSRAVLHVHHGRLTVSAQAGQAQWCAERKQPASGARAVDRARIGADGVTKVVPSGQNVVTDGERQSSVATRGFAESLGQLEESAAGTANP